MKVKIVSDGTPHGTRITDETGNPIEYVDSIDWEMRMDRLATATVRFVAIPVEVEAELRGYRETIDRYVEPDPEP